MSTFQGGLISVEPFTVINTNPTCSAPVIGNLSGYFKDCWQWWHLSLFTSLTLTRTKANALLKLTPVISDKWIMTKAKPNTIIYTPSVHFKDIVFSQGELKCFWMQAGGSDDVWQWPSVLVAHLCCRLRACQRSVKAGCKQTLRQREHTQLHWSEDTID